MKKTLLITFTLFFLSTVLTAQITFVETWAHYGDNAPTWFTNGSEVDQGDNSFAGTERGIVYNSIDGNVYVLSI